MNKVYICIDLKSFYASVECRERLLDPMKTNLVVADSSRTEKTICLAVSPALKSLGVSSRPRLYEVIQKVRDLNRTRGYRFITKSYDLDEITSNPKIEIDYIVASPRMNKYIEYSTKIYNIYLKYISTEDIYVYSIDEVFCDITKYLKYYNLTPKELITKIIKDVYDTTGITATAGIVSIEYINILNKSTINCGTGKLNIYNSILNNLDLDLGVGDSYINSKILGNSKIRSGRGSLLINIMGTVEDYKFNVNKGIGTVTINNNIMSDDLIYGEGTNFIELESGIGSVEVNFYN